MDTAVLNRSMSEKPTPDLEAAFQALRRHVADKRQLVDDLRTELRDQIRELMYIEAELARRADPLGLPRRRSSHDV